MLMLLVLVACGQGEDVYTNIDNQPVATETEVDETSDELTDDSKVVEDPTDSAPSMTTHADDAFDALSVQLNELVAKADGTVGISFYNLTTRQQLFVGGDHLFFGASTAKMFTHLYIADLVAEGELSWEQTVTYHQDEHFEGGTGVLQNRIAEGEELPIADLLRYSIRYSDNIAHNMLSSLIAPTRQERRDIVFARYLSGHQIEGNYLTANHLAQGLKLIDAQKEGHYAQIYEQMRETIFRDRLNTGPATGEVAHIIGTNEAFVHDAGIFRSGSTSYILVVMTEGVSEPNMFISDVSRLVWSLMDE